ncbi:MAG: hypothetical protein L0H75_05740, partial [Nitrosospira sp.]|nr:hypothetical protein [Nitrosospira sp.]
MTYSNKYMVVLTVKGDMAGDGMFVAREVWRTLEEYLELVKRNDAGGQAHEIYEGSTGAKLSVIASTRNAT